MRDENCGAKKQEVRFIKRTTCYTYGFAMATSVGIIYVAMVVTCTYCNVGFVNRAFVSLVIHTHIKTKSPFLSVLLVRI